MDLNVDGSQTRPAASAWAFNRDFSASSSSRNFDRSDETVLSNLLGK